MPNTSAENCVFCKIVRGELEGSFVYEDETVVALMDIVPINEGHVFVIPRAHAPHLSDMDDKTLGHMANVAGKIAKAIRKSDIQCDGINLLLADGETAGQEVWHAHLHVIPRFKDDGFGTKRDPIKNFQHPSRIRLDEVAKKLKKNL